MLSPYACLDLGGQIFLKGSTYFNTALNITSRSLKYKGGGAFMGVPNFS